MRHCETPSRRQRRDRPRDGRPLKHAQRARLIQRQLISCWVSLRPFAFAPGVDISKEPNEQVLTDLLNALKSRVAKGPSAPSRLSPQQQREIRARLKTGESPDSVARGYNVDVATIRHLARLDRFCRQGVRLAALAVPQQNRQIQQAAGPILSGPSIYQTNTLKFIGLMDPRRSRRTIAGRAPRSADRRR
jgi:hypothetical protein